MYGDAVNCVNWDRVDMCEDMDALPIDSLSLKRVDIPGCRRRLLFVFFDGLILLWKGVSIGKTFLGDLIGLNIYFGCKRSVNSMPR